jgi:hypothetical protein
MILFHALETIDRVHHGSHPEKSDNDCGYIIVEDSFTDG